MSPRQIRTLMRRLFYGDIPATDGYRHLMRNGVLSRELVEHLVDDYMSGNEVLVYLNAQECRSCRKVEVFPYVETIYQKGRIRLASTDFSSRIMIEPIGVGIGSMNAHEP